MSEHVVSLPSLIFGWWNTNLSPHGKPCKQHDQKIHAAQQVIETLIFQQGIDFLAIGEVTEEDIRHLKPLSASLTYAHIAGTQQAGKAQFDIGVFYHPEKIPLTDITFLTVREGTSTIKVALKVALLPNSRYAATTPPAPSP